MANRQRPRGNWFGTSGDYIQVLWDEDYFEVEMEFDEPLFTGTANQGPKLREKIKSKIDEIRGQLEAE